MAGSLRPVTPQGILAARLAQLVADAEAAGLRGGSFLDELRELSRLAGGLEPYVARYTSPESPALSALAARTAQHDWAGRNGNAVVALEAEMLSGQVEGVFLRFLARMTRARSVLDIGMFTGYSALALAEALEEGGRVIACELDPDVAAFAAERFSAAPAGERIEVRIGPALDTLLALAAEGEAFDLVFIDADKPGYVDYLRAVLDGGLLAPGGTICADNTLMQGAPWTERPPTGAAEAIVAFNAAVAADPGLEQVLVPLRDGVTLIRRAGE